MGLSPTRFETFHRVTLEYLMGGLPVIGTHAFGIPDAIEHEVNGLLVETGDAGAFTAAVLRVLDDRELLARLRAGASGTVVRSDEEEAVELLGVLQEAAARRG